MDNVFEQAVCDFYRRTPKGTLLIHNNYGEPDEMPLDVYLRGNDDLSDLEIYALQLCEGKVLDIGAGLGALTMILQSQGKAVEALEISPRFCEIMSDRGISRVRQGDFMDCKVNRQYDTLLMMMNGFGLCGSYHQLPDLFKALKRHLAPGGQILFDSSDISYLYDKSTKPGDRYFGEMDYQYEYAGKLGPWFKWLYLDPETLRFEAERHDFSLQVLYTEESGQYLGRLSQDGYDFPQ